MTKTNTNNAHTIQGLRSRGPQTDHRDGESDKTSSGQCSSSQATVPETEIQTTCFLNQTLAKHRT